MSIRLIEERNG